MDESGKSISKNKGEDDMEALLEKECSNTQECLDIISSKLEVLKGINRTIILNKSNKKHAEWYNDEDNSGK